jgi:hypothetical protein
VQHSEHPNQSSNALMGQQTFSLNWLRPIARKPNKCVVETRPSPIWPRQTEAQELWIIVEASYPNTVPAQMGEQFWSVPALDQTVESGAPWGLIND